MANPHTRQTPDLATADRSEPERWVRRPKTSQALALRARIVLGSATGRSDTALAAELGTTRATAGKWRKRFIGRGLEGLLDEPCPGAPRQSGTTTSNAWWSKRWIRCRVQRRTGARARWPPNAA